MSFKMYLSLLRLWMSLSFSGSSFSLLEIFPPTLYCENVQTYRKVERFVQRIPHTDHPDNVLLYPSIHSFIHSFLHPFLHLFISSSPYLSISPSIYNSIQPFFFFWINFKITCKHPNIGLPRWCNGKESTYHCRRRKRCGFNPWNLPQYSSWEIPWTEETVGL